MILSLSLGVERFRNRDEQSSKENQPSTTI